LEQTEQFIDINIKTAVTELNVETGRVIRLFTL